MNHSTIRKIFFALLLLPFLLMLGCQSNSGNALEKILQHNAQTLGAPIKDLDQYEVQILFTQIDRDTLGTPSLTTYRFNVDSSCYFYSDAAIKLPVAAMSLEKLNIIYMDRKYGLATKFTPIRFEASRPPQTEYATDSSATSGLPTIAHILNRAFLANDKNAYNRLYEFVGLNYINNTLRNKGCKNSNVFRRLDAPQFQKEDDKYTNAFALYGGDTIIYEQKEQYGINTAALSLNNTLKGTAHIREDGTLIQQPFNFSDKNFMAVQDLHQILKIVTLFEYTDKSLGFMLTEQDYDFLFELLLNAPQADKYLSWATADAPLPSHIKVYSVSGKGYGYMTDNAYIVDTQNNVEFLLTATVHVNENQVYNDDQYEYETVGKPFLSALGRAIYEYELARKN